MEEPAGDLAVALALVSSVMGKTIEDVTVFGELGLSGEIRGVHFADLRLKESLRFGFRKAIVPKGSAIDVDGMQVVGVRHIREAIEEALQT